MKRIVDHMKRNPLRRETQRENESGIDRCVRFITFTYQAYLKIQIQIRNIIATEKNYERFVDSSEGSDPLTRT